MDIKIDLERPHYIQHRLNLMKSLQIPPISEAQTNLGQPLAQILFDHCDFALKEDFGLTPLKGAGDELWISPSDLLIGKVALKPPLTSKHIQALTHQGILSIGAEVEKKFWNETRLHEENYFDARKRYLADQFEELWRIETKNVEQRERLNHENHIQRLMEEFNEVLVEELDNLEVKLKDEYQELLKKQKMAQDKEWENKLKVEAGKTVQSITEKFLNELDRQKNILASNFKLDLQKAYIQRAYDINLEKSKCAEHARQLRHNLECKNIANMMYVLCMERKKCCADKAAIEEHYTNEIQNLNKLIVQKDKQITKLTVEKNKQIAAVGLREACILEIIKQFQKFINFALRAAPTQAEFLLSVEKMMVFELTNTIMKSDYDHLKPCEEILPWQPTIKPTAVSAGQGLIIPDHHDCLNQLNEESTGASDVLPAFTFRDRLYVRQDFRDMIKLGMKMSKSDELWNKDVEVLMDTLNKSVSQIKLGRKYLGDKVDSKKESKTEKSPISSMTNMQMVDDEDFSLVSPETRVSLDQQKPFPRAKSSMIQFSKEDHNVIDKKRVSLAEGLTGGQMRRMSGDRRSSIKGLVDPLSNIDFKNIGTMEKKPALIAATNSLELIDKRGSIRHFKTAEKGKSTKDEKLIEDSEKEVIKSGKRGSAGSEVSFKLPQRRISHQYGSSENLGLQPLEMEVPQVKGDLVLEARDSIVLRKSSLLRKSGEFTIHHKDSFDIKLETKYDMKRRPSKLTTARNSLELIRESKSFTDAVLPANQKTEPQPKTKPSAVCAKCKCQLKGSYTKFPEIEETDNEKHSKRESTDKTIKMSHACEIIPVESNKETNVAINATPIVYETESPMFTTDLLGMYAGRKLNIKRKKTKKVAASKDKFLTMPKTVKIIGDTTAKEHLQTTDEFTEQRIHSLIELIRDNPTLMHMFTAGTR
ncbi:hypothetical protein NQ315_011938 [Exocentrus adspersus]|uniref:Uncharacterized protein n=1 Tax=Exocentrus adspersus TaxID=1586481 RepID=A0AAV8W1Z5_9CUCU|nr:hypothetical protein NQ315_011938 [Exocentrus adspersus]